MSKVVFLIMNKMMLKFFLEVSKVASFKKIMFYRTLVKSAQ